MILYLLYLFGLIFLTDSKLYQVYSLARHGARYHVMDFYDGLDTLPLRSELTAVGMRQHQKFGETIRKQYIESLKFLSPKYNESEIEVFTTHTNRTQTSIESFMYGLYPPGTGPRLTYVDRHLHIPPYSRKDDIQQQNYPVPNGHQPIRVKNNQKIIISYCPNYDNYSQQNFGKIMDSVNQMNSYHYPFIKRMSQMFNFSLQNNVTNLLYLTRCFDAISVDKYLGRPLPKNFTEDDYKNLQHFANWYFYNEVDGNNSLMINTFKLQKIINAFDLRTRLPDTYALKWTFVSGHDTDVWALHLALNISSANCVEEIYRKGKTSAAECQLGGAMYASNVIVQLHSNNGKDFFVKVRSNGKYVKLCSKSLYQCDYTQFKALIRKSITTKNMNEFCGQEIKQSQKNKDNMVIKHQIIMNY